MEKKPRYSVVIPVFNSSVSLIELSNGLIDFFQETSFEVIFIDDGSTNPKSWETISQLSDRYKHFFGVRFRKNFGKPSALLCGFQEALGDFIVTMDDDLQHDPKELSKLISLENHDVVIGEFQKKQHSLSKRVFSSIKNRIEVWAYHKPSIITISPFKLIKREIVTDILKIKSNKPFIASLIFAVTNDIVNISVVHQKRKHDKSGFTYLKGWQTLTNLLFNNSSILLRIVAFLGMLLSTFCVGVVIFLIIEKMILGNEVNQFIVLLLTTSIIGGVLLFAVGIIGEYLIRIISGVEKRPAFFVAAKTRDRHL
jgi:glycosyltransferase involved in cell wall biosynthesis